MPGTPPTGAGAHRLHRQWLLPSHWGMDSPRFSILMVCTGNVCRSPFAEALLRRRLEEQGVPSVSVRSAGTMALVGSSVAAEMLPEFDRHGLSPDGLVGNQLDHGLVGGADLILTMSRRQRSWIIEEWPEAGLRTAMLTSTEQLPRTGGSAGPGQRTAPEERRSPGIPFDAVAVPGRAEVRAWARSGAQRTAEDVMDPYGRSPEVARRSSDAIEAHVSALCVWLANSTA